MMEEPILKKKNKRKSKYIYFSILTMFLLIGISYGLVFFVQQYNSESMAINTDLINVTMSENGHVEIDNADGQKDSEGINNERTTIEIKNNSNAMVRVTISLEEENTSTMDNDNVRFALFQNDEMIDIGNLGDRNNILYQIELEMNDTITLQSTLWLDYYYKGAGESFRAKYNVVAEQIDEQGRFYLKHLVDKDKGIVKVSDTEYRYTTENPDNYVYFNSELWRIIGVVDDQIQIVSDKSFTESTVDTYYANIMVFYKRFVDESKGISTLSSTDTYNSTWITNTTKKTVLNLKKTVYIVEGNGTEDKPYLLSEGVYIMPFILFERQYVDDLLANDGDARILSGSNTELNDNYIWYSGKLWRIVALNNDGSIKLVTQDQITAINWGSNTTYEGSWMYQWLNEDFLDTLYNYENIIVTDYEWNATVTTATTKPAKTTMVEAAVGLLTAYEYTQSYSKLGTSAYESGYLNNGYSWWLLTPYSSSNVRNVGSSKLSYHSPNSVSRGGRPSINLSSNIKIKGNGDGSRGNPYLLEGDITKPTNNVTKLNKRVSGEYLKFDNELYRIVNIENGITKITKTDYIREGNTVVQKYFSSTTNFGSVNNETCIDGTITYTVSGTTYTRNCNEYWDYYLNNDWYNNISTSPINYKGMIVEGTWYLGQYPDNVSYKNTICATSNTAATTKNCTRTTAKYEGYVGLGRVGEPFTSKIVTGDSNTGYSNSNGIWTITPHSSEYVRSVDYYGDLYKDYFPDSPSKRGRPSINLSSNIVITGGFGTENEPFEINGGE